MYKFKVIDGHLTDVQYDDEGDFDCYGNYLTTIEGCPKEVNGSFNCSHNRLTNLEGCPKEVKGDFNCAHNHLTTLEESPKIVNGDFDCYHNHLTSLEGCPEVVNGWFCCHSNSLTTLEGCPKVVKGNFDCAGNWLTTLKGCPEVVNGHFSCDCNPKLEDISDLPETVSQINIYKSNKIKVFPKHINNTLTLQGISKGVLNRLKKQKHLEIIEEGLHFVNIREKTLGNLLLEAI